MVDRKSIPNIAPAFDSCYLPPDFSLDPLWSAVATKLSLPLSLVIVTAYRLVELASASRQRGFFGGDVSEFDATEFGRALDAPAADVERIFLTLQEPEFGWIADSRIVQFEEWQRKGREENG
jgi:hypothetical protein